MNLPQTSQDFAKPSSIVNLMIYQCVWFACVFGAAQRMPNLGVMTAIAGVAWHLVHVRDAGAELRLILLTGLLGGAWDSLLVILNLVEYSKTEEISWMAPFWIFALWMAFATTFNVCLRWLRDYWWLAVILGGLGGPLAWWAGDQAGALELVHTKAALLTIGLGWSFLLPVLMALAKQMDGVGQPD